MYRFKKLMVHLNLDAHDENLVRQAGLISKMANSEEVCFVHMSDTFNIPNEIKKIYPELSSPVDAAVINRMKEFVGQYFRGSQSTKVTYHAHEGAVLGELVFLSKKEDIDLLIVGQYKDDTGATDTLSEKLARKAFCSVLIIPEASKNKIEKILVAIDYSDYSLNALDVGSAFAKASGSEQISILNNYRVPKGYHKTGKTYEEFSDIMLENSKSKLKQLLPRVDLKSVGIQPYFRKNDSVVEGINRFSEEIKADLIVVGARGRSGDIAAILLGSITEGLIRNLKRPLIAVKEKGEGLNILDALSSE